MSEPIERGKWHVDEYGALDHAGARSVVRPIPMTPDDWRDLLWVAQRALGMEEKPIPNASDEPWGSHNDLCRRIGECGTDLNAQRSKMSDLARRVGDLEIRESKVDHLSDRVVALERFPDLSPDVQWLRETCARLATTVEKIVRWARAHRIGGIGMDRALSDLLAHVDSQAAGKERG